MEPNTNHSATGISTSDTANGAIRDGSVEALYRRYFSAACRSADAILASQEDAEDVAQDVFVSLLLKLGHGDGANVGWRYIERATRNRALDRNKLAKRRAALVAQFGSDSTSNSYTPDVVERQQEYQLLLAAVDRLPERCREVIRLALMTGWSQSRIAKELDLSTKAVAKQYARARRIVRELSREPACDRSGTREPVVPNAGGGGGHSRSLV
jgi:RNA polymerase sigma factor (sigma-70 family)